MSVEPTKGPILPGVDSPIESIRKIQEDRIAKTATPQHQSRKPVVEIYLTPDGDVNVDSVLKAEQLLPLLVRVHQGISEQVRQEGKTAIKQEPLIVVP